MTVSDIVMVLGSYAFLCALLVLAGSICDPGGLYDRAVDWLDARRAPHLDGGHLSRCVRVHPDPAPASPVRPGSGPPRPGPVVSTGFPPFPDGRPVPDNTPEVHV